jgi:hypothetical protein
MSVWTYTVGGSKFGDRVMAMRWYMLEKGLQKIWNEFFTFVNRAIGGNVTLTGGRTTFGEIDFNVAGDVTTVIPKNFVDPAGPNANVFRQMPGYPTGQVEEVLFEGFNG